MTSHIESNLLPPYFVKFRSALMPLLVNYANFSARDRPRVLVLVEQFRLSYRVTESFLQKASGYFLPSPRAYLRGSRLSYLPPVALWARRKAMALFAYCRPTTYVTLNWEPSSGYVSSTFLPEPVIKTGRHRQNVNVAGTSDRSSAIREGVAPRTCLIYHADPAQSG